MKIVFFRHLPTKNNLSNTFIGTLDLECDSEYIQNNNGIIIETMKHFEFDKLYCSPLKRAIQSLELFFPMMSYEIDQRLIERDLGNWKNVSKDLVKAKYPSAYFPTGNLDFNFTPPNGEDFLSLLTRVFEFLKDIFNRHNSDEKIGIVTHNGIITAVKCLLLNTTSTENIEFQKFLVPFVLEMNVSLIEQLEKNFREIYYMENKE